MRRGCRDIVSRMAETCQDSLLSLLLATALPVEPNPDPESLRSGLGIGMFHFWCDGCWQRFREGIARSEDKEVLVASQRSRWSETSADL